MEILVTQNSKSINSISWPVDQHRWPAKSIQNQANLMNRSLDCGVLLRNLTGFENVFVIGSLSFSR